jgi:hypothetical protein
LITDFQGKGRELGERKKREASQGEKKGRWLQGNV